ncbi:SAPK-interacting protein 1 [Oratosquilla oratoria]|uniref:SAPK-interacting protein 1 n=1 Tax=Oratosquilla oratoria TaxID=337810 RepID=UPI003F776ADA
MAMYDDRQWLISHIQNSYVTSDDTGLCDVVLLGEVPPHHLAEFPCLMDSDSRGLCDDMPPHSLDIASDMDFGGRRIRSNTQQRIEKLRKEKKSAVKVRRVAWQVNPNPPTEDELNEMFARKAVIQRTNQKQELVPSQQQPVSLLSQLLRQFPQGPTNPFVEYAKYDGNTHINVPSRRISIYLLIGGETAPDYPMPVCVLACARVYDLIGLICYLYTKENREYRLKDSIDYYSLHIAEEDGQVDWDFQALPLRDTISKFRFDILALVENKNTVQDDQEIVVTINVSGGAFSKIQVENYDITIREILTRTVTKRKDIAKIIEAGLDYHLERECEPGKALDPDRTLAEVNCREFALVRDNSKRDDDVPEDPNMISHNGSHYQTYKVLWVLKLGKCDATLGISADKVDIMPLQLKSGSFIPFRPPHAVSYNMESVVDCKERSERKGKMELQITCRGEHRFKDYIFECDARMGHEVLEKCKHIFELRTSSPRKEFLKEKKPFRRHNSLSVRRKPKSENHINEV